MRDAMNKDNVKDGNESTHQDSKYHDFLTAFMLSNRCEG